MPRDTSYNEKNTNFYVKKGLPQWISTVLLSLITILMAIVGYFAKNLLEEFKDLKTIVYHKEVDIIEVKSKARQNEKDIETIRRTQEKISDAVSLMAQTQASLKQALEERRRLNNN